MDKNLRFHGFLIEKGPTLKFNVSELTTELKQSIPGILADVNIAEWPEYKHPDRGTYTYRHSAISLLDYPLCTWHRGPRVTRDKPVSEANDNKGQHSFDSHPTILGLLGAEPKNFKHTLKKMGVNNDLDPHQLDFIRKIFIDTSLEAFKRHEQWENGKRHGLSYRKDSG